jgi:hypothetical protein
MQELKEKVCRKCKGQRNFCTFYMLRNEVTGFYHLADTLIQRFISSRREMKSIGAGKQEE